MKHQEPTPPNTWLYKDIDTDNRMFVVAVDLPDNAPLWDECTDGEKKAWEEEHSEPKTNLTI